MSKRGRKTFCALHVTRVRLLCNALNMALEKKKNKLAGNHTIWRDKLLLAVVALYFPFTVDRFPIVFKFDFTVDFSSPAAQASGGWVPFGRDVDGDTYGWWRWKLHSPRLHMLPFWGNVTYTISAVKCEYKDSLSKITHKTQNAHGQPLIVLMQTAFKACSSTFFVRSFLELKIFDKRVQSEPPQGSERMHLRSSN